MPKINSDRGRHLVYEIDWQISGKFSGFEFKYLYMHSKSNNTYKKRLFFYK